MLLRSYSHGISFAKYGLRCRAKKSVVGTIVGRPESFGPLHSTSFSSMTVKSIDVDATWEQLQKEALAVLTERGGRDARFGLKELVEDRVLSRSSFEDSLSAVLHAELNQVSKLDYYAMASEVLEDDPSILESVAADLDRFLVMDPAAGGMLKI